MKKLGPAHHRLIIWCFLLIFGCTPAKPEPVTPDLSNNVVSLREYYPSMLEEAQKWHSDAYLESARIFLYHEASGPVISAVFFSPSEDYESHGVRLYAGGTIVTETSSRQFPILHRTPITDDNWKIDSSEALELMLLDEENVQFVNSGKGKCSNLWLRRITHLDNQPIIWSLSLWDCSDFQKVLYLDANSGTLVDSATINVTPTRIPTSLP